MQKIDIKSKNPIERINNGLKVLVDNIYNKLNYITVFIESNKDLHNLLYSNDAQIKLFDREEDVPNRLAIEELIHYIELSYQRHIPVTMKTLLDQYTKAPYGWLSDDIRGLIVRLFRSQEIQLQLGGDYLHATDKNLIQYLTKKDFVERLLIKKRIKTPEKYIKNAKYLLKEVFNKAFVPGDEDGLMNHFKEFINEEHVIVERLLDRYENNNYPGKDILENGKELFETISSIKDTIVFYEKLYELKKELLDYEEEVYDVKQFFKNQREQFDKAVKQLEIYEKNKTYVLDSETNKIVRQINEIIKFPKPYSHISKLPNLIKEFNDRFVQLLEEECKPVRIVIENDWQKVKNELELYDFKDELYSKFNNRFKDLLHRLDSSHNFYEAIAMKEESDRLKLRCFEEIKRVNVQQAREKVEKEQPSSLQDEEKKREYKPRKIVNVSIANIFHGAKTIESEEDIEELLVYLRRQLKERLEENTTLKLI